MKKLTRKWIAVVLSMLMVVGVMPLTASAEAAQATEEIQSNHSNVATPGEPNTEPAPILTEVPELREENVKHFRLEDGTYLAAQYEQPVHYEDNGEWKDIDNTLTLQSAQGAEDVEGYENAENPINIKLAKHADSKKLVKMKQGQYQLSWAYAAAENHNQARALEVEPVAVSEDTDVDPKAVLDKLTSGVSYDNIEPGIDLQYILSSTSLKENIIVKQKRDSYTFELNLNVKKLTPTLQDNGSITFNNDDGETIFTIPAPFMTDADGNYSEAVSYTLVPGKKNKEYTLTITADADWMNAEGRAFPVTIDPIVSTPQSNSACTTTNVFSEIPYESYLNEGMPIVGQCDDGTYRIYMEFHLPDLPTVSMVTGAMLSVAIFKGTQDSSLNSRYIEIYNAQLNSEDRTIDSVAWENQPDPLGSIIDHSQATASSQRLDFDITKLAKIWYENGNSGLMIKSSDETNAGYHKIFDQSYLYESSRPILTICYTDTKGLESHWSYHTQTAGRVTSCVNDFNGNLVLSHTDLTESNLRMPFSVVHVYNSAGLRSPYSKYNSTTAFGLQTGMGFQLNLQQRMDRITDSQLTSKSYNYVWLDGDGTQHYFKSVGQPNTWVDEDGLNLTLTKETVGGIAYLYLADKDDNLSIFNEGDGLLYYVTDNLPDSSNTVARRKNYIGLGYNGAVLQRVYNPEGQTLTTFVYNSSNYLTQLKDQANRITTFSYNSWNQLTTITYPDGTTTKFDYFTNSAPYSVTGTDDTQLYYSYSNASYGRIQTVQQKSAKNSSGVRSDGQKIVFQYLSTNCTGFTYTTRTGNTISEMYEFDRYGRVFNIENMENGGAASCVYTSSDDDKTKNRIASTSTSQTYVNNLLNNSNCEWLATSGDPYDWITETSGGSACSLAGAENAYLGEHSIRMDGQYSGSAKISQRYDSEGGKTYTFSAYTKGSVSYYARLYAECYTAQGSKISTQTSDTISAYTSDWERLVLTFTTPANTAYIKLTASYESMLGTAYFDCLQLEEGESANSYALLSNADFEDCGSNSIPTGWSTTQTDSTDGRCERASVVDNFYGFYMKGDMSKIKTLYQEVTINKPASEVAFSARAKGWGDSLPWYYNTFGVRLKFFYSDNSWEVSELVRLNPDTDALQTVTKTISASEQNKGKTIARVQYVLEYGTNANGAKFYQPQMYLDLTGTAYTYDAEGNLETAKDNAGHNTTYDYDDVNPEILKTITNTENEQTEYEYSSVNPHQVVAVRQSATDTSVAVEYDAVGNVTKSTYYAGAGDVSNASNAEKIVTSATTQSNGYLPFGSTDALGHTSVSTYNARKLLTESTDAKGNEIQYYYNDNNDRLEAVVGHRDDSGLSTEVEVDYEYNTKGQLERIAHNGFYYQFGRDQFGNQSSVSVGKNTSSLNLVINSYYDGNGPLKQVQYANGRKINYTYDNLDRLDTVAYDNVDTYSYVYDSRGNLARVNAMAGGTNVTYQYDLIDRLVKVVKGTDFRIGYTYDVMNRLTGTTAKYLSQTKTTGYSYDTAGRQTAVTLPNGKSMETSYDDLGRLLATSHVLSNDSVSDQWNVRYYYNQNADFTQSGQVRLISGEYKGFNGVYQMYDYDANGNVSHTYDGKTQKHRYYHYDGLNQLVREDNEDAYLSTVYSYDNGGNILSKTVYAYNAGNLGSSLYTVNYGYNDVVWGDKLTSYNGQTISYDNIGNPLSYRNGMSFTWEHGRQMKTFTNSEGSTWEYTYDNSGYRTKKKLLNTTYEYMLDGSRVVCMKTPTDTVWFYYDANGQRVAMDVGGTVYYYIYNLMGDVIGLYDGSGNVVARYAYDAWGKIISVKDGNGNFINATSNPGEPGVINPFRYRGYMYDTESGLYYLNSRYYDPETGRFVNADAILILDKTLLGTNIFAYCNNNPVNHYDVDGYFVGALLGGLIGGIGGALGGGISAALKGEDIGAGIISGAIGGAAGGAVAGTIVEVFVSPGTSVLSAALIGAGAGAVGGGLSSATSQCINHRLNNGSMDGFEMDWAGVGISAGLGALCGSAGAGVGQLSALSYPGYEPSVSVAAGSMASIANAWLDSGVSVSRSLKTGDRLYYKGWLYSTSYGEGRGQWVEGNFIVTRVISNRSFGVQLNNGLGWIRNIHW